MNTRRFVPAADCLILSQVCGGERSVRSLIRTQANICRRGTYGGDGVEGRVGADAEVGAGDVVGDGGGDDHHGNTHLFVLLSGLNQLQTTHIGLQAGGEDEDELGGGVRVAAATHLKSTDDHQSVDVKPGDVLTDLLQHFTR